MNDLPALRLRANERTDINNPNVNRRGRPLIWEIEGTKRTSLILSPSDLESQFPVPAARTAAKCFFVSTRNSAGCLHTNGRVSSGILDFLNRLILRLYIVSVFPAGGGFNICWILTEGN